MNIQRRTFLQVLGALGISIAAPVNAVKQLEDFKVVVDTPPLPEHGMYALIAYHREMTRSPFWRVPLNEVRRVFDAHAVKDGDYNWVKLPLIRKPYTGLGDPNQSFLIPGGTMALYSAYKIVHCVSGVPLEVRKNRINGDLTDLRTPAALHTTKVAMLHPMNNAFNPEKEQGEILIH